MPTSKIGVPSIFAIAALLVAGCAHGGVDESEDAGAGLDQGAALDAVFVDALVGLDAQFSDASETDAALTDGAMADLPTDAGWCPTGYTGPACTDCAAGYQDNDTNGSCTPACGAPGVCEATLGCDDSTGSPSCASCPVVPGAQLAWTMELPARPNWNTLSQIVYSVDNRATLSSFPWTRIGFCLVLDSNAAYVELDDYTTSTLEQVTLPMDWIYDQPVTNLTVRSTVESVVDVTRVATGSIEMWSNCYSAGPDGLFDADDDVGTSAHCYGSFQVHNDGDTILAWNGWSYVDGDSSAGIGNNTTSSLGTDWTGIYNVSVFSTRQLSAYVVP